MPVHFSDSDSDSEPEDWLARKRRRLSSTANATSTNLPASSRPRPPAPKPEHIVVAPPPATASTSTAAPVFNPTPAAPLHCSASLPQDDDVVEETQQPPLFSPLSPKTLTQNERQLARRTSPAITAHAVAAPAVATAAVATAAVNAGSRTPFPRAGIVIPESPPPSSRKSELPTCDGTPVATNTTTTTTMAPPPPRRFATPNAGDQNTESQFEDAVSQFGSFPESLSMNNSLGNASYSSQFQDPSGSEESQSTTSFLETFSKPSPSRKAALEALETRDLPEFEPPTRKPPAAHPSQILPSILAGLSSHPLVYAHDSNFAVAYDGYPKSSLGHLLVLFPSRKNWKTLADVSPADLPLLRELAVVAARLADHVQPNPTAPPLIGFHAIPSLFPLHLHIVPCGRINAPAVKTIRHVQSFTTPFFIPLAAVVAHLETSMLPNVKIGVRTAAAATFEKNTADVAMRCHLCGTYTSTKEGGGAVKARVEAFREHQRTCMGEGKTCKSSPLLEWELKNRRGGVL